MYCTEQETTKGKGKRAKGKKEGKGTADLDDSGYASGHRLQQRGLAHAVPGVNQSLLLAEITLRLLHDEAQHLLCFVGQNNIVRKHS